MTDLSPIGRLANIVIPVADIDAAVGYYVGILGLTLKFRDGARWAAVDAGGLTLGLAGPPEHPLGRRLALSFKVLDVDQAVAQALQAKAALVSPPRKGPHEIRALVSDADGNLIYLYSPLPPPDPSAT